MPKFDFSRLSPLHYVIAGGVALLLILVLVVYETVAHYDETYGSPKVAVNSADAAKKFDALNSALDAGLITKEEYDAKVAALTAGTATAETAPSSPTDSASGAPAPQGNYNTQDNDGGGKIVEASFPDSSTLDSASADMLRRIHSEFGSKPEVTQVLENSGQNSVTFFFHGSQNGAPSTGMAMISTDSNGHTGGLALYDSDDRFPQTIRPMLQRVGAVTDSSQASQGPPQGPEPLMTQQFSDGTGSMGVPADWRMLAGGGGSASAEGPTGEIVSYNMAVNAMDPNNPRVENYLRGLPPGFASAEEARNVMAPFPNDPVRAWSTVFVEMAQQHGKPLPNLSVKTVSWIPVSNGSPLALISGEGTIPNIPGKSDDEPGTYLAIVQLQPPNTMGQWMMISTWVFVPKKEFARYAATALAVLQSIQINFQRLNEIGDAIRNQFAQQFNQEIENDRRADAQRYDQFLHFTALNAQAEDNTAREARAMINFAGDRMVIQSPTTGNHYTVDSQLGNAIVADNPGFRSVPSREFIPGIDY